ncbi:MAG: amidohydrolase [Ignavibacteria bacterium]|nr:amidohydrolase [Ignavibacteria bacterium]
MKLLTPTQLRHKLHQYPELAFEELGTTNTILQNVKNLDGAEKLKFHSPMDTGLLVEYKVNDGGYLLFRADIDALPIIEENEIEFKSTNEFMHACGHDVHTSILYSFLIEVLEKKTDQNILFLFQPAEEAGGGALKFYNTGVFDQFDIKNAFALHVTDEYPLGTIASTPGVLFASALEIDIEFIGESAHVAFPSEGKNAFNALRKFLDAADDLQSQFKESILLGLGKFNAGSVRNITPGNAKIEGSIRGLSAERIEEFYGRMEILLTEVKDQTEVKYEITRGALYPEVSNNRELYNKLKTVLSEANNFIDCGMKFTGEDFGFFSQKFPSFMFWLGTSKGERYGLHNPKFLPPDEVIEIGKNILKNISISV